MGRASDALGVIICTYPEVKTREMRKARDTGFPSRPIPCVQGSIGLFESVLPGSMSCVVLRGEQARDVSDPSADIDRRRGTGETYGKHAPLPSLLAEVGSQ